MIKAVIFDLYGVLGLNGWQAFKAEHLADKPDSWERIKQIGKRVDEGQGSQDEFVAAVAKATEYDPAVIRAQFENTTTNGELLHFIEHRLVGAYKVGLLSNTSTDVFDSIFSPEELAYFDVILSSFHVGLVKPDPAMYRLMCSQLGVELGEAIIIDDKPKHVDAANELGMHAVLYRTAEQAIAEIERLLGQ